jgi:cAMP-dependent protein kinase regulator
MIGFGEIALLQNDRRTASIIAIEDQGCDCWVLSADVFKHIIAQNNLRRRGLNLTYLNQVELFKGLETYEKLKIIDGLKIQTFKQGEFVFREGEVGNEFFIIEEGSCECLQGEEGAFQQVRNLSEGNHFGEVAIIKDVKRTLSVRALTEMRLLALSRDAFVRILGSIKEKLEDYLAEKNIKMMDISFESENSNKDVPEPVRPKHLEKTIKEVDETDD